MKLIRQKAKERNAMKIQLQRIFYQTFVHKTENWLQKAAWRNAL